MTKKYRLNYLKSLIKEDEVFNESTGTKLHKSNGEVLEYAYCDKCQKWKPITDFYVYNGNPITACKQCKKEYYNNHKQSQKEMIENLKEKIEEYEKAGGAKQERIAEQNNELTVMRKPPSKGIIGKIKELFARNIYVLIVPKNITLHRIYFTNN